MTLPIERAALVAHARERIERGSKSFRFASRLFDPVTRERSWLLYAWCRACDDLADGQSLGHEAERVTDPKRRLLYLTTQTRRALAGQPCLDLPFDALRQVAAECTLPHRFIEDHLAGFARDCEGWSPATEEDLLSYCYQVAGAVGCLMAVIMGVSPNDEETLQRACDLGIAFQLTNIVRDIGEDHSVGRCYLPGDWLKHAGLKRDGLMEPANREQLVALAGRLHRQALAYRDSARVGAAVLPIRSRWAVLSAARIYGGIANKVHARGAAAWDGRVTVPKHEKLAHVMAAAGEATMPPRPIARAGLWTLPR